MSEILRGHMDAAEYKHVVLGMIFLKHISDAFDVRYAEIETDIRVLEREYEGLLDEILIATED